MLEKEPVKAEIVKPNIVPSEAWLRKHRERMNCARPVAKPEPKPEGKPEGKPPVVVKPKEAQRGEGEKEGQALGQPLGLGDGGALGLGDGWGW